MNEHAQVSNAIFLRSDIAFNALYPLNVRMLSNRHWTPIHIAQLAVDFLAKDGGKILDIGSGVGKFCLAGAHFAPTAQFFGVEQRDYLIKHAESAQKTLDLSNVSFIHKNFTQLNLREFDHFYFFNSFYENVDSLDRIDEGIDYSRALFDYYVAYLRNGLEQMPQGTKLATFHSFHGEVPAGYEMVASHQSGDLIFWIKK